MYDEFKNASSINSWINKNTLGLIDKIIDDEGVKDKEFFLINALGIDMEWKNVLHYVSDGTDKGIWYYVDYAHEKYNDDLDYEAPYSELKFNNNKVNAKSTEIKASINNYDIVKTLGEDSIRKTVGEEYKKWLATLEDDEEAERDVDKFLDGYIKELNSNYKKIDYSTDFSFYTDSDVKVFAKDLKEYNGTTLQYVGIMPNSVELNKYIENIDSTKINNYINGLKSVDKLSDFTEGKVTQIYGQIPLFSFEYSLKLKEDLQKLGITNVFDKNKSDLTNLVNNKVNDVVYVKEALHKSNIDFSNDGIKASSVTVLGGGLGNASAFDYLYDVPIEKIDLTFDKPYMFMIRDKKTGEVWFTGTVYEPTTYKELVCNEETGECRG